MFSVHQTLSLRYLQRRWLRALLIVASIALGVGSLVATRVLNETMTKAAVASTNPMAGVVDFIVSNGDLTISRSLVGPLRTVVGVKSAQPRIVRNGYLPDFDKHVTVMGIDLLDSIKDFRDPQNKDAITLGSSTIEKYASFEVANRILPKALKQTPVVAGKALADDIPDGTYFLKFIKNAHDKSERSQSLAYVPYIDGTGPFSFLGGYVLILDLPNAAAIFGMEDQIHRIDIALEASADHDKVRKELDKVLQGRASLKTPEEQNQSLQSPMSGMQTGFSLCGVAALVVGIFLVYNSLSVTVAERRHEIGILLAVGATRAQVCSLFAGEAGLLGLAGSLLGIPLGIGLAKLSLAPVQSIMSEVFISINAHEVETPTWLLLLAGLTGVITSMCAALVPAVRASRETPADAVRRVPKAATVHHLVWQASISAGLIICGTAIIACRAALPAKFGIYGGLILVLLGALVASPFFAAVAARLFQPLARRFLGIEWRLAADNIVRSPGRTGLVIGALAAGVSLVVQTAGTIRSNRLALSDWLQQTIGADLIVTAGSAISVGELLEMEESVGDDLRHLPEVQAVLSRRKKKAPWGDTYIMILAVEAAQESEVEAKRHGPTPMHHLMNELSEQPDTVIVSENFAALHHVKPGDVVAIPGGHGEVKLRVIGQLTDYTWNHGSLIVNRKEFKKHWLDDKVSEYDVYLKTDTDPDSARENVQRFCARYGLSARTRTEILHYIDGLIERLYGVAYGQQVVVMLVAALGVVMALLISVLQRRRELGLLRAIGASRAQVIYSVLAEACLMGVLGTLIGLIVGIPLQWYVLRIVILEESGYLFAVHIPWLGGLLIALAAMTVATLAGLGPAVHAVRMRIPEAIAYE